MRSSVSEALPKTYHQPIGPAARAGMGCVSIGRMLSRTPSRALNQSATAFSQRFMIGPFLGGTSLSLCYGRDPLAAQGVLQREVVRGLDFQAAIADPPRALEQAARRRPGGDFAAGVVDAPVAGAHEQPGL